MNYCEHLSAEQLLVVLGGRVMERHRTVREAVDELVHEHALVRRQGPLRVATRAARLGCSPTLTRTPVVACSATALDTTGVGSRGED